MWEGIPYCTVSFKELGRDFRDIGKGLLPHTPWPPRTSAEMSGMLSVLPEPILPHSQESRQGPRTPGCHLRPEALPHCSAAEGLKDTHGRLSVPMCHPETALSQEISPWDGTHPVDLISTLNSLALPSCTPAPKPDRTSSLEAAG